MALGDINILLTARDQASRQIASVRNSVDGYHVSLLRAKQAANEAASAQETLKDAINDGGGVAAAADEAAKFSNSWQSVAGKIGRATVALNVFYEAFKIGQSIRQDNQDITNGLTGATAKLVKQEQERLRLTQQQEKSQAALNRLKFGDDEQGFLNSELKRIRNEIKTQSGILDQRKESSKQAELSILNSPGIKNLGFLNASISGQQELIKFEKEKVEQSRRVVANLREQEGQLARQLKLVKATGPIEANREAVKQLQADAAKAAAENEREAQRVIEEKLTAEKSLIANLELKLLRQREGADAVELEKARRKGVSDEILKQAAGIQNQIALGKVQTKIDKEREKSAKRLKETLRANRSGELNPLESRTLSRGNTRTKDERQLAKTDKLIELEEQLGDAVSALVVSSKKIETNTRRQVVGV